jgi:two-component system OmpR family response regulator
MNLLYTKHLFEGDLMSRPRLILIADDDPHIREVVRFALEKAGFLTAQASDGKETVERFMSLHPDLLVLDIVMPEMDGTEVCRQIRSQSGTPIVFLSSRDEEVDRIIGLELGGDDYVTKPFSPRELVARVKAVLRRSEQMPPAADSPQTAASEKVLRHGHLEVDLERFEARWDGKPVVLTLTEFGIVRTLVSYPGKVFTRDELMSGAYTHDNIVTDRTIDSHVRRVRRKFASAGADPVETVHGLGYRLGSCEKAHQ